MYILLLLFLTVTLVYKVNSFVHLSKSIHSKLSIIKPNSCLNYKTSNFLSNYQSTQLHFSDADRQTPPNGSNTNGILNESRIAKLKAEAAKLRAEAALLEAEQREALSATIANIFNKFDVNNDGSISADELRLGLEKELRLQLSDEQATKLLKSFDDSGDGLLQLNEFKSIEEFKKKLDSLINDEKNAAIAASLKAAEAVRKAKEAAKKSSLLAELINDKPPTISDRLVSVIAYLIPLFDSFQYGKLFITDQSFDNPITIFIALLYNIYQNVPFSGLIAFFTLTILSNNLRVNKLIRFNFQQAILIDIALIIPGILGGIISVGLPYLGYTIPVEIGNICSSITFLTFSVAILYSLGVSLFLGQLPNKIPYISNQVEKRMDTLTSMIDKEINAIDEFNDKKDKNDKNQEPKK